MAHLYFNIIGVTLFLAVFYGLNLVLDFSFIHETVTPWGIAVVHSIFNLTATAVLLPFANGLEKLAILTIPDDAEKESFALLDAPAQDPRRCRGARPRRHRRNGRAGPRRRRSGHEPDSYVG